MKAGNQDFAGEVPQEYGFPPTVSGKSPFPFIFYFYSPKWFSNRLVFPDFSTFLIAIIWVFQWSHYRTTGTHGPFRQVVSLSKLRHAIITK